MIISDYTEYKKFYKEYGIHFAAVNEISISDEYTLDFYK